jgi:hypothetical protein
MKEKIATKFGISTKAATNKLEVRRSECATEAVKQIYRTSFNSTDADLKCIAPTIGSIHCDYWMPTWQRWRPI